MDLWRAFEILEIDENSPPTEIKQRYRDLAAIWHPDHHSDNPRRQQIAQEKMKEVNAAYDCICAYLLQKKNVGIDAEAAATYGSGVIVTCPHCGIKNRVGAYDHADAIRCGKCGKYLSGYADESQEDEWEKRTLCGDENCIGVIGPNGRCSYCGRSFEEAREESKHSEMLKAEELRKAAEKPLRKQKIKFGLYIAFGACVIVFIGLMISGSFDKTPEQKAARPQRSPGERATLPAPTEEIVKKAASSRTGPAKDFPKEGFSYENYFTKEYFNKSNLDKDDMVILQRNLVILGYKPGQADGIIGNKTFTAVKQFSNDFRPEARQLHASGLLALVNYHAIIASAHPDWCKLYKGGELNRWLEKKPEKFRNDVEQHIRAGDPRAVITLLNWYKFEKEKPTPLALPNTSIVKRSFDRGLAPLSIRTKYADQHHYIKLIDLSHKKEILTAFIRGGTTLSVDVPLGNCELRAAVGKTWYGDRFLFGPNTAYSKADKIFDFKVKGNEVRGYNVELFLQPHGNLSTRRLSENSRLQKNSALRIKVVSRAGNFF